MKKNLFMISVAAVTLASCSNESTEYVGEGSQAQESEIAFRPLNNSVTRSAINGTTFKDGYDMLVSTYFNKGSNSGSTSSANFFEGVHFTKSSSTWKSNQGTYYYPLDGTLDFLAVASAGLKDGDKGIVPTATWGDASGNKAAKVVLTVPDNSVKFDDLLYGAANAQGIPASGGTPIAFNHAMTSVVFVAQCTEAYDSENNKGITITGITIDGAKYAGTLTIENPAAGGNTGSLNATWSGVSSAAPATSGAWDHISARVWDTANTGTNASESALTSLNLGTTAASIASKPFGEAYVILPEQTVASITVSYTVHNGKVSSTPVDKSYTYTFTPTDGTWLKGKKYVYSINFTLTEIQISPTVVDWDDDTNGDSTPDVTPVAI